MATALNDLTPSTTLRLPRAADRLSLTRIELFYDLPDTDRQMLEHRLPIVRWQRGSDTPEALLRPDHLYVIRSGHVAEFDTTDSGHEVMTSILDEGCVYSTLGSTHTPSITALKDAAISPLSGQTLEALISRYPKLGRNLAHVLSQRVAALSTTTALISEMRVEDRLRARVHQLGDRFGIANAQGIEVRLDLTHAQWASLVGASREAVTTGLAKLRANGQITMDGRIITIPWHAVPPVAPARAE